MPHTVPRADGDTAAGVDEPTSRRRRAGGRSGNTSRRRATAINQMPWAPPINTDRPVEPLDQEGVERIHAAAMHILENVGVAFLNAEARQIAADAGCIVEGEVVRMGREFVLEMVGKVPDQFTLTPRNPARAITVGGNNLLFGNVSSPPNYFDLEIGKKLPGTREYCANLMKLTHFFNCIHFAGGYPVEPVDVHPSVRHLDIVHDKLLLTDKVVHAYSLGSERVEDVMDMVRIAGGLGEEAFRATPRMYTNINSTSPLKHDHPMIDGCLRCIRRGQAVVVTPFTLAGAMAPVTIAGAVAQSIAEALCAIALFQYVAPGCACVFGTFTSNVDMKSGAPAFGTPEYMRATQISGQMARHYGLPLRSSGVCTANVPDGQAMWETAHSLWAAVQSGSHMVYHGAGWLEGGLIACPEKFVMDCEILQQIQRYMQPELVATSDDDLALAAIAEVGHNGHFFGAAHTQERYETAFYQPYLSDWSNFEAWEIAGAEWTPQRAHKLFKTIINEFEAPALDPAIAEELGEFVDRRKREGGAPTDF